MAATRERNGFRTDLSDFVKTPAISALARSNRAIGAVLILGQVDPRLEREDRKIGECRFAKDFLKLHQLQQERNDAPLFGSAAGSGNAGSRRSSVTRFDCIGHPVILDDRVDDFGGQDRDVAFQRFEDEVGLVSVS